METIVGIASLPDRENSLTLVINSLLPQVDKVYVALNGHKEIPMALRNLRNVECVILDNSLSDGAKFYFTSKTDGYYVAWDDDILAPPNAVETLIAGVNKYNGLVSFHGKYYIPPITNFKRWAGNYRCLNTVVADVRVNVIGSGCCAFNTNRLSVQVSDFKTRNKADIWLSKITTEQGVPMFVLQHRTGYIQYLSTPKGTTIWETTRDYSEHANIMKTFIK